MFISFIKRALPFILTLIFGIGLGSIFGSSTTTREVAPNFSAPAHTYRGCQGRHRSSFNSTTSSPNGQAGTTQTRSEPVLVSQ